MDPQQKHLYIVTAAMACLAGAVAFLAFGWSGVGEGGATPTFARSALLEGRLSDSERRIVAFFNEPARPAPAGPGIFFTDYFKPPPPPPPPPPPKVEEKKPEPPRPPPEKTVNLTYRGFVEMREGQRVAYLMADDQLQQRLLGEPVAGPWKVESFSVDELVVSNGENTVKVPFNRSAAVKFPAAEAER
jgi:hypothetical protein